MILIPILTLLASFGSAATIPGRTNNEKTLPEIVPNALDIVSRERITFPSWSNLSADDAARHPSVLAWLNTTHAPGETLVYGNSVFSVANQSPGTLGKRLPVINVQTNVDRYGTWLDDWHGATGCYYCHNGGGCNEYGHQSSYLYWNVEGSFDQSQTAQVESLLSGISGYCMTPFPGLTL